MTLCPAIDDLDVPSLDIAQFLESLLKRKYSIRVEVRGCGTQKPDYGQLGLLCQDANGQQHPDRAKHRKCQASIHLAAPKR